MASEEGDDMNEHSDAKSGEIREQSDGETEDPLAPERPETAPSASEE